jgi:hypothetical protein
MCMKYLFVFLFFVFSLHLSVFAQAKSPDDSPDYNKLIKYVMDESGLDQVLVNGIYYEDKYGKKTGHEFFQEDRLYTGNLSYRGKVYKEIEMEYDICNQQLILNLEYNDKTVAVVPPNDFISAFNLDDKIFTKDDFQGEPRFYQVVFRTEKLKCLYYWFKQTQLTNEGGNSRSYYYEFTDGKRKSYLKLDRSYETYRNNKSFTELFPREIKAMVRQYLKTNRINVAKSNDEEMTKLLIYCNSLL